MMTLTSKHVAPVTKQQQQRQRKKLDTECCKKKPGRPATPADPGMTVYLDVIHNSARVRAHTAAVAVDGIANGLKGGGGRPGRRPARRRCSAAASLYTQPRADTATTKSLKDGDVPLFKVPLTVPPGKAKRDGEEDKKAPSAEKNAAPTTTPDKNDVQVKKEEKEREEGRCDSKERSAEQETPSPYDDDDDAPKARSRSVGQILEETIGNCLLGKDN